MPSDNRLYNVFVAIPVDKEDQAMFQQGYQYREELTEHLVDLGGQWIGSGFGWFCDTATHHAFDIQVAYADEDHANRAATFAQKWLRDRGYLVSPEKKIQYDGEAYAFWVKFDPASRPDRKPAKRRWQTWSGKRCRRNRRDGRRNGQQNNIFFVSPESFEPTV